MNPVRDTLYNPQVTLDHYRTLFVRGLNKYSKRANIYDFFSEYGEISNIFILTSNCEIFLEFETE